MTVTELVTRALERRPKVVLTQTLQVSPMLLARWASGKSTPSDEQVERLRALVAEEEPDAESAPGCGPPADDEGVIEAPAAPPGDDEGGDGVTLLTDRHNTTPGARAGVDPETGEPAKGAITCEASIKACSVSEKTVALGVDVIAGPRRYHDRVLGIAEAALASGEIGAHPVTWDPEIRCPAANRGAAVALVDFARQVVDGVMALPAPGQRQPESGAPAPLLRACAKLLRTLKSETTSATAMADAIDLWREWSQAGGAEAEAAAGGAP